MQAVILAAGLSRRLKPLTDSVPKCLLKLGNKNLLQMTVENVIANGIKDFLFVTGFKEEMIKNFVNENFPFINKIFIYNSGYESNNNSYSLWLTKQYIKDDIMLLDSDIFFDKEIILELLKSEFPNCLAVNFTDNLDEEQIKVIINDDDKVLEIGKQINIQESSGESIGIEKFSSYFMKELFIILERKITKENNINEFYEASFQEVINQNEPRNSIYAVDVSQFKCMEIDTIQDYEKAQRIYHHE